jgi:hypothetical protein
LDFAQMMTRPRKRPRRAGGSEKDAQACGDRLVQRRNRKGTSKIATVPSCAAASSPASLDRPARLEGVTDTHDNPVRDLHPERAQTGDQSRYLSAFERRERRIAGAKRK